MPRIDFYVLPDQKENGRALLACRLADKAYGLGHTVYLFTASEARAAALDDLLWTFRQDSFVPHERYPLVGEEGSPVLVGTAAPAVEAQVLINWPMPCPKVSSATSEWWNWWTSIPRCWRNRANGSGSTASRVARRRRISCSNEIAGFTRDGL
ncbi:MAG: DNA polymerase III subunit chi [Candidatus Competibacteraceae bacterium]